MPGPVPNESIDNTEEDAPVVDLRLEGDLYPEASAAKEVDMDTIAPNLPDGQQRQLQDIMAEFPRVIEAKPGCTTIIQHEIHVGDTAPIRQRPYRIPYSRREAVKKELNEMLASGIIQPSTSPWASPIVLVEKKDGGLCFCVDFCKLNQVARFDAYPMPLIKEFFESVGSAAVLTTLDLASGYWQIPMAPESQDKTAFTTPFGLFKFEVMPFGLHSAPATFQRMINHVL